MIKIIKGYQWKLHKVKKGYWAECLDLPNLVTQGDDMNDLLFMIDDIVKLYFEEENGKKEERQRP
jgi:predicted RNase H-like HicB family nuclease